MRSFLVSLAILVIALFGYDRLLLASAISLPIDQVRELYKAGRPEEGRSMLTSMWPSAPFLVAVAVRNKQYSPQMASSHLGMVKEELTNALSWERDLAHSKDGSEGPLALARTARMAAAGIYKEMVDARAPSDESYYYDIAAFSLAALVRTELKQLESAQKTDEVGKLRTEYAQILAMKEPKPDPDSEIILTLSCASPGPLQRIDACYVMKMPEEARSRFLKILEKMRSDAVAAATNGTVMAGTARIPKAMVDHIYHVVAYERAQTAEYTQNQYFPAAGLPMLEKSVQVTQDAYDALAKGKSDPAAAATLAECAPLIARLKKVVDNARTEANKVPAASNPATTATSDANTPDWRGARIITGEHLRVCTLVNEFFEAMAEENAARLRSILAGGGRIRNG